MLHFEEFLREQPDAKEIMPQLQDDLKVLENDNNITSTVLDEVHWSNEFTEIFARYDIHCDGSCSGKHGKTSQFWFRYLELMNLFHNMSRAVRTGNLNLYIHYMPTSYRIVFCNKSCKFCSMACSVP